MNLWGPPLSLLFPGWKRAVKGATWPAWRPHSQTDHVLVNEHVDIIAGRVCTPANHHRAVRAGAEVVVGHPPRVAVEDG